MDITLLCRPLLAADLIALPRSAANIGLLRMSPNLTMQLHEYKFAPQRLNRILSFKMLGIFSRIPRLKSPEPVTACEQPGVPGRWSRLLSVHAGKQLFPQLPRHTLSWSLLVRFPYYWLTLVQRVDRKPS